MPRLVESFLAQACAVSPAAGNCRIRAGRCTRLVVGQFIVGLVVVAAGAARAEDEWNKLIRYVPEGANLLITIDMAKIIDSPKGNFENWRQKHAMKFAEGVTAIPADAERAVLASQFDVSRRAPRWDVMLIDVRKLLTPQRLTKAARGYIDELIDVPAAWSPYNAYYVRLSPTRLGIMAPANRQRVSRWAKSDPQQVSLSGFLAEAYKSAAHQPHELFLAFDLEDALDPELITPAVDSTTTLSGSDQTKAIAKLIGGLRGVVVLVNFAAARPQGEVRLVFDRPPTALAGISAALFSELLANQGAAISGLEKWKEQIEGNSVVLTGELDNSPLHRLLMLTHLQLPEWSEVAGDGDDVSMADASLRQFTTVQLMLNDLRIREVDHPPVKDSVLWLGKYAQRIESLGAENVDPALAPYRIDVVDRLRRLQDVIQEPARPKVDPDVESEIKAIRHSTKEVKKTLSEKYQREF